MNLTLIYWEHSQIYHLSFMTGGNYLAWFPGTAMGVTKKEDPFMYFVFLSQ